MSLYLLNGPSHATPGPVNIQITTIIIIPFFLFFNFFARLRGSLVASLHFPLGCTSERGGRWLIDPDSRGSYEIGGLNLSSGDDEPPSSIQRSSDWSSCLSVGMLSNTSHGPRLEKTKPPSSCIRKGDYC
mmetsp:Transcript_16572/g.33934  ORF Transcript_16572/g.33934 Transcript_16572/m.33934 type:complete len:130 (-) Transcript_16572:59-448(-)